MQEWTPWHWPFLERAHSTLAEALRQYRPEAEGELDEDLEPVCRALARDLGQRGLLDIVVPQTAGIDLRSVCLAREAIAYHSAMADSVFAMQGIGTSAIRMFGTEAQKARYLGPARAGEMIAGFALTEPGSGSDVANIATTARRTSEGYVLNGSKTLISNAPFADFYIVLARTDEQPGARGLSAFIIERGTPGLVAGDPIALIAPHPVGTLTFNDCTVSAGQLVGAAGEGFKIAMATFDIFRTSVGAAAVGMARRARDEALMRVLDRKLFGSAMADLPGVQTALADMEIDITTAALAVYSAAWTKDTTGSAGTREASIAKYVATEQAWRVIDTAVQLFGGAGVTLGSPVEKIFREARAMRIYEGASEVQKIIVARDILRQARGRKA